MNALRLLNLANHIRFSDNRVVLTERENWLKMHMVEEKSRLLHFSVLQHTRPIHFPRTTSPGYSRIIVTLGGAAPSCWNKILLRNTQDSNGNNLFGQKLLVKYFYKMQCFALRYLWHSTHIPRADKRAQFVGPDWTTELLFPSLLFSFDNQAVVSSCYRNQKTKDTAATLTGLPSCYRKCEPIFTSMIALAHDILFR